MDKIASVFKDKSIYKFLLVGGLCTGLDFCIYILMSPLLGVTIGKLISMLCSMILNYFLNKFWTFTSGNVKEISEIIRYIICQAVNLTVNVSINTVMMKLVNNKIVAFIIATGAAMAVNFCLQRFWVFRVKVEPGKK